MTIDSDHSSRQSIPSRGVLRMRTHKVFRPPCLAWDGGETVIPTLPSPSDIPTGPERPEPIRALPPTIARSGLDEFELLKKTVQELRERIERLEVRVSRMETGSQVA